MDVVGDACNDLEGFCVRLKIGVQKRYRIRQSRRSVAFIRDRAKQPKAPSFHVHYGLQLHAAIASMEDEAAEIELVRDI